MREIRTSGSMSGDGKRDQDAPGVQSTRARPRLYPLECQVSVPDVARAPRLAASRLLSTPVWNSLRRRQSSKRRRSDASGLLRRGEHSVSSILGAG